MIELVPRVFYREYVQVQNCNTLDFSNRVNILKRVSKTVRFGNYLNHMFIHSINFPLIEKKISLQASTL